MEALLQVALQRGVNGTVLNHTHDMVEQLSATDLIENMRTFRKTLNIR